MDTSETDAGMGRRLVLLGGVGVGLAATGLAPASRAKPVLAGVPSEGRLAFQVWRKGAHIGENVLRFEQLGDALTVQIEVHILVRIGPVPVMKYTHSCKEHWAGGLFQGLESTSHSNMDKQQVTARRTSDGISIQPAEGDAYTAPIDSLPISHWNRQMMSAPLFNPQDGKPLRETARVAKGEETVKIANGSSVRATRYGLVGDATVDDWYDASGVWTALHSRVVDGSYIEYLRL
jgi:hypothetical protein